MERKSYQPQRIVLAAVVILTVGLCLVSGEYYGAGIMMVLGMIASRLQDIASR